MKNKILYYVAFNAEADILEFATVAEAEAAGYPDPIPVVEVPEVSQW
jgi:hypothetical protein